jgi:hypothetical protein
MKKTYRGRCHCGKVRFEADIDVNVGRRRCNCWICARQRARETLVKPEDFRLLAGESISSEPATGTTCSVGTAGPPASDAALWMQRVPNTSRLLPGASIMPILL